MFDNQHYAQASVAYLRAGRGREAAICDAFFLREKARLISTTANAARIQVFLTAANTFIACARDSPPKRVKERLNCYGAAGECYLEAGDLKTAGDHYRIAEQYDAAARAYRGGEHFHEVVEMVTQHGGTLNAGLLESLETDAKLHYFKVNSNNRPANRHTDPLRTSV